LTTIKSIADRTGKILRDDLDHANFIILETCLIGFLEFGMCIIHLHPNGFANQYFQKHLLYALQSA